MVVRYDRRFEGQVYKRRQNGRSSSLLSIDKKPPKGREEE
jgi:hypothetical protein